MDKRYWLTPAGVYVQIDEAFGLPLGTTRGAYDPCPCPAVRNTLEEPWGDFNYANPPFRKKDGLHGGGPTAFFDKAEIERGLGHDTILVATVQSYVAKAIRAGAIMKSLGRVKWLEVETGEPMPGPSETVAFYYKA
jgi:hypothetical protein